MTGATELAMSDPSLQVPRASFRMVTPTLLRAPLLALAMTSAAALPWCFAAVLEARMRTPMVSSGTCREAVVTAAPVATVPAVGVPVAVPREPPPPAVERLDDDLFLVRVPALTARLLGAPTILGDHARFQRRGRLERGVRVLAARPGGIFESLGLEAGDLVQRVDDVTLTPRSLAALADLAPRTRALRVDLLRRGVPVTLRWVLLP
jgi:hypothetical protein